MIGNAVVDKPLRGKGIGMKQCDAAIRWAKKNGLRYIQTTVSEDNTGAREFNLDQGFHLMTL